MRFVLLVLCCTAHAADPLPALRAEASNVTVSGVSSGGYMAVQMHVAHSSFVKGAAAIAAGPYYCAQASLMTAQFNCMKPAFWAPLPETAWLHAQTEALAAAKRIDATANLSAARI
jgi:poly(3-hydroxybutyrate) depolymerase